MANAYKCDRCGKLYENYDGIRVVENGNGYNIMILAKGVNTYTYDLCPGCMQKLVDFIKEDPDK